MKIPCKNCLIKPRCIAIIISKKEAAKRFNFEMGSYDEDFVNEVIKDLCKKCSLLYDFYPFVIMTTHRNIEYIKEICKISKATWYKRWDKIFVEYEKYWPYAEDYQEMIKKEEEEILNYMKRVGMKID